MPIRGAIHFDVEPLSGYLGMLRDIQRVNREAVEDVREQVEKPLLASLQRIPPKPSGKKDWQTGKQQSAYFASDGFGGGIPTRRTGRTAAAWRIAIRPASEGGVRFVIENIEPHAKFLYGSLDRRRGAEYQQRMHRRTGWPLAAPIIDVHLERAQKLWRERIRVQLRAAYSRSTRRRR